MNKEKIEHEIVERALAITPAIVSAEVIFLEGITLPGQVSGDAYVGIVVVGKGKEIPGASITPSDVKGFEGRAHAKILITTFFVVVLGEVIHVYLENRNILNF